MTTGYGTPGMEIGAGEDGRCLSSQAALPPSGLSRQEASQAKPAAANAALLALADRCEAATGPDRELDDLIYTDVVGGCLHNPVARWTEADGEAEVAVRCEFCGTSSVGVPRHRYTSSLDTAMALVPEGMEWLIRAPSKDGPDDHGRYFARLETADFEAVTWGKGECWLTDIVAGQDFKAWGAMPALAFTAAILRARAGISKA